MLIGMCGEGGGDGMKEKGYVAIYLRLSLEDREKEENGFGTACTSDESGSITGQRKMLLNYIQKDRELSGQKVLEFCDDGFSGTKMDRPGMQELLKVVRQGKVSCILVKDLSRFSRDYIELGTYLNQIFPFMKVRFISVNDHYDSREHEGSTIAMDTAFRTLLYDLYSKDLSGKVKASFQMKRRNGEYITGELPLGYERSREKKNAVVVNEREAEIVRYIFNLAAEGMSSVQIAGKLVKEQIPTPMQLHHPDRKAAKEHYNWSGKTVRRILNNRFYLGDMVYGKTVRETVGRPGEAVPKEQWKVIPKHHEPIVTPEMFAGVKRVQVNRSPEKIRGRYPLTGKVYCGGCGYAMSYGGSAENRGTHRLYCAKYSILQIPECCACFDSHTLEEIVLTELQEELKRRGDPVRQKDSLKKSLKESTAGLQCVRRKCLEQCRELFRQKDSLYIQYAEGTLDAEEYRLQADKIDRRIGELSRKREDAEKRYEHEAEMSLKVKADIKQIMRFSHLDKLIREAADIFVGKVTLYRDKRVEIEWKYAE